MVMQRSSWADEEVVAVEQMHSVNGRRRVRQRNPRRRGAMLKCQMEINGDNGENFGNSGSWSKRMPAVMGAEESPSKKVYTQVLAKPSADIQALLDSPERCKEVVARLAGSDQVEQHEMLMWLQNALVHLALTKGGCRIVQKFFEVTGGVDRDLLIAGLQDHIVELYESPHGNFVLSRAVEVLPAAKNAFIISALIGRGIAVCKHRFGCRIVCRLMEHCTEDQIGPLLDEILPEAAMLALGEYGNYIVMTALEHASQARQLLLEEQLLPGFTSLTMHKDGSRVAERLLDHCSLGGQNFAIRALLQAEGESSLVELACGRYGSYVIAQLAGLRHIHIEVLKVASILASNLQYLQESQYAERVINAFGLAPAQ